jgi:hypothetical protein
MNLFNHSGDNYGSSRINTPSIKGHLRPLDGDFGFSTIIQPSVLDNVRTNSGKTRNYGVFLPFQLSFTQHTKERTK